MRIEQTIRYFALTCTIGAAACGGQEAAPTGPQATSPTGTTIPTTGVVPALAGGPAHGTAGAAAVTAPGQAFGGVAGGTAAPTTGIPTVGTGTAVPGADGIPCDVATAVSENCTLCHGAAPKYSAPMPLMKLADFMAPSKLTPTRKVYETIPERLNATDVARRMPPASSPAVAAPGLKALNDWLTGGAKPVAQGCPITEKASTTMPTTETGGTPSTRSGGATDVAQTYNDPMMKCYEFRAHSGDKVKPFTVGTTPDMYTNFTFMPPWQGMQYARSFRILDGNDAVIHHWLFYKNAAPVADGASGFSTGAHPDGELVHGWAPGGSNLYFDPDVGLEMPSSVGYTLETHHNNTTGTPAPDNSGLEVCVTSAVPKNVASLSWLGTDNINGTTAAGTCAPASSEPIHIIGVSPHMHTKGTHMSAVITRAGGKTEMLHDAPFDFNYQHSYNATTLLMPGDTVKTTCKYSSPVRFGEGTGDEMCYLFTLYYPKLSLTNGNPVGTLIHGPNTCLE